MFSVNRTIPNKEMLNSEHCQAKAKGNSEIAYFLGLHINMTSVIGTEVLSFLPSLRRNKCKMDFTKEGFWLAIYC